MARRLAALAALLVLLAPTAISGYTPRGEASEYRFTVTSQVARWDPCQPIGWRVNLRRATRGALADTRAAFWRLGQITGLTFRYRGSAAGVPQMDSNPWFPADTQIVVAWVRATTLFDYAPEGDAVAAPYYLAGYHNTDGSPAYRIASGSVVIRARPRWPGGYGPGLTRGDILLHELGHLMGLAHVDSPAEMMFPVMTRGRARYGLGDLAGLAAHGAAMGCLLPD